MRRRWRKSLPMSDATDKLLKSIRRQLAEGAEPDFAAGGRNFFCEPVDPHGVRSAKLNPIENAVYREIQHWPLAERDRLMVALWESGKLEEGVIVAHVYRR